MVKTPVVQRRKMDSDDDFDDPEVDIPAVVNNIFIDGLKRSKNNLITNQLERLFEIKTFAELISESNLCKLKLERLGVFKAIEVFVDLADTDNPDDFDVYFYVRELPRINATAGTNVGHNDGNLSLGAKLNNLRGLGEALKAQVSYGTKVSSSYDFSFTKPSVANSDQTFSVHALKSVSDMVPSFFRENASGLGASFSIPGPVGMHSLAWNVHWRENSLLPSAPFEIREHCGHSLKSALRHSLVSDGRDDWIFPSEGHYFKHNIEYSGVGGDISAIKTDVEVHFNKEIFSDIVLAASLQAGGLRSLSGAPPLINDRYFLGGPLSVRGYAMRGIGQHADSASLGGELFWASGLHIYAPLPFRPGRGGFGELFRLHLFLNSGNLANVGNLDAKDFLSNPRLSFGIGIMLVMGGMARLELNYCIPKNARPDDMLNPGFQLGVGVNFL